MLVWFPAIPSVAVSTVNGKLEKLQQKSHHRKCAFDRAIEALTGVIGLSLACMSGHKSLCSFRVTRCVTFIWFQHL